MSLRWTAPTDPDATDTEFPRLGAVVDDGTVTHTVWAPSALPFDSAFRQKFLSSCCAARSSSGT